MSSSKIASCTPCGAVIVAAGSGIRMGQDKMLLPVAGRPLLGHSVAAFDQCDAIAELVIVCSETNLEPLRKSVPHPAKPIRWVSGGVTRAESVLCGLRALNPDCVWVAVHDGARPLVSADAVARCITAAVAHGGATLAERVTDTLQRDDDSGHCAGVVDRSNLWRIQTPQIFPTADLINAHESAIKAGIAATDETGVMLRTGVGAFLVENGAWNFKVTVPGDVAVAEFLLAMGQSPGDSH